MIVLTGLLERPISSAFSALSVSDGPLADIEDGGNFMLLVATGLQ
jgi:hypothetical protein